MYKILQKFICLFQGLLQHEVLQLNNLTFTYLFACLLNVVYDKHCPWCINSQAYHRPSWKSLHSHVGQIS